MPTRIERMSAIELLSRYRRKTLSPVEATKAVLAQIDRLNPTYNAYCLVDHAAALKSARASEKRWMRGKPVGPLDGVPVGLKDLMLTKGWPTLRGSKAIDPNQAWDEDAPSTDRLREAGAVFLGKTTTPEFGWKGVTDSVLTGVTRNPWDKSKTPGGSSGGASAALAAFMGPLMTGSDGGGSIRIPAAFTGVYGIKGSFGRVPAYPASPFGTVSHIGPMTRTVADSALMLQVMAQPDWRDWYQLESTGVDYTKGLNKGVKGLKIGYSPDLGYAKVDPEVAKAIADGAKLFQRLGAKVEEVDPSGGTSVFKDSHETFQAHWFAGAANLLSRYSAKQRSQMDSGLQAAAEGGAKYSLLEYMAAVKRREDLGTQMNKFHETYDLLLTPAMPIAAFEAGIEVPKGSGLTRWTEWTPFSYPFNLTRQPAASIPCGFTRAGLPIGLQLVGPLYGEAVVLRASRAFEEARPFAMPDL
ncbi:MAG: amidase [Rhodospirillales bacterium]|nr:amidase [Rhodospirillales bacterium]